MEDKDDKIKGKSSQKVTQIFYCNCCHYNTSKKTNYDKHLTTTKHQRMTEDYNGGQKVAKSSQKVANQTFVCECGKIYKHRQGLWKHKKVCLNDYSQCNFQLWSQFIHFP